MKLVCLDLEGVLVPEIWIGFAEKTGIEKLKRTTRDEPNYNILMKERISILNENKLTLNDIQNVIKSMEPLDGAIAFIDELRSFTQLIILSDTFEEFAQPFMEKLSYPTIFCNSLQCNEKGMIVKHKMRIENGKQKCVESFKSAGLKVFSAGDSYNDLNMIENSDRGALFKAPEKIIKDHPHLENFSDYNDLMEIIKDFCNK